MNPEKEKQKNNILTQVYDKDEDLNKCDDVVKKNTIYHRTKMSNVGLKLSKLYAPMQMYKLILITVAVAIFFGVISVFFVKNVGIYNFGLAAFGQAAARLIVVKLPESIQAGARNLIEQFIFWIAYIILSIPIFIFGYKKIGKVFTHLTVIFLVVSSFISFGIGQIPNANNVYIIGHFANDEVKELLPDHLKGLSSLIPLSWKDGGNIAALMIYSVCYGYMLAWIFAIIGIIGGTAGVTGVIGEWYANTKQKSFGSISGYMNIVIVFICVFIGSYLPGSLLLTEAKEHAQAKELVLTAEQKQILNLAWSPELYLSPNFIATFLTNVVYIIALNKLYPKFKLVRIEIFSNKTIELQDILTHDKKIVTGLTMFKAKGGFEGKEMHVLTSITLFRQVPRIMKKIRKIDQTAFVAVSDVSSVDGYVYIPETKF
ncbi:DUF2179 domain-containing protein [Mycoplasma sp. Ms02]|uniref:DUF2179 domain-containing protein n=1 Tax=Mycoplasma sp. Ms02 TaxID=353851 RepID=UPI001C8970CC|nr:DUF2179 domain-containing protein [Mycoplasma sp. Ms02]QZE12198.1 DUF2179 domain-containing protein [Mycoplasma sp. Ms02]